MNIADLTQAYTAKTDEELLRLASQRDQLTSEAQSALASELAKRRIEVSIQALQPSRPSPKFTSRPENRTTPISIKTGPFIEEVLRFYSRHRWVFMQLIFPAILLGLLAITFARNEAHAAAQAAKTALLKYGIPIPPLLLLKISLISASGYLTSWMVFCFSFATICSAVEQEKAGYRPSISEAFSAVRGQFGPFLRLSMLLLGMFFALEMAVLTPISILVVPFVQKHLGSFGSVGWQLDGLIEISLIAFFLVHLALAMPAVILDDLSVRDSLLLSYKLTRGKLPILAVLLFKGVFVSYVAAMLPLWLARWIPASINLPSWFHWVLSGASILCVTVVEPVMFIGFAMLYVKMTSTVPDKAEAVTA